MSTQERLNLDPDDIVVEKDAYTTFRENVDDRAIADAQHLRTLGDLHARAETSLNLVLDKTLHPETI